MFPLPGAELMRGEECRFFQESDGRDYCEECAVQNDQEGCLGSVRVRFHLSFLFLVVL